MLNHFLDIFYLSSLITEPTCFKSDSNPSCIDLILTNSKNHFMKSSTFEPGISDFHKLTTTIMKLHYVKLINVLCIIKIIKTLMRISLKTN